MRNCDWKLTSSIESRESQESLLVKNKIGQAGTMSFSDNEVSNSL